MSQSLYGILNFLVWEIDNFHTLFGENSEAETNNLLSKILIGFCLENNFVEHCEAIRVVPTKLLMVKVAYVVHARLEVNFFKVKNSYCNGMI